MECNAELVSKECPCTAVGCDKKGKCCACVAYHRIKKQLPACYFDEVTEKTYDRSISNFIKTQKEQL